ncbi:MAG: FG-GAP-like repeat-containing protein, partial [Pseudorhizobium sp.]
RTLYVNVFDSAGANLSGTASFTQATGAANPFNGIDVGYTGRASFVDLDGDGDLDAVVGANDGRLSTFRNDGGAFTRLAGAANPFNGVDLGYYSSPSFVDLDGDGDLDAVVGNNDGVLAAFRNTGGSFTPLTGAANPFDGIDVGLIAAASFVDLDGDGDLDAVVGNSDGVLAAFRNAGGIFTPLTGAANPFNGIDVGLA